MSIWKQILVVAALALTATFAWIQLSPFAAPTAGGPGFERAGGGGDGPRGGRRGGASRVVTAEVVEVAAGSRLTAIGTARAARSVTLHSEVGGIVRDVSFTPGDPVRAGDVLLRLDDREQRIAVAQAERNVETARNTAERYDQLSERQAIAAVQAEEARAELARAENELAAAELALERRTIVAPFDGVTGFAQVEVGDMIDSATPIASIDDRSTVTVEFNVPERFAAMIERGRQVTATTAAHGPERFDGRITAMDTRVDESSRTLRVRAGLPNEDDRLRPGMAFSVALEFDTPGRPAVPEVAVQWSRDGAYVWKVKEGTVARTPVTVIARTAEAVLIEGDIAPDDTVVAQGLEGLRDGAEITEIADISLPSPDPAQL